MEEKKLDLINKVIDKIDGPKLGYVALCAAAFAGYVKLSNGSSITDGTSKFVK